MLKFEQRRRAREMGLEAVVWAFDPLQASNAAFNLGVLGATCRTYEVDLYGSRTDTLNAGLATDRLLAEWSTTGESVGKTARWADGVDLIASGPVEYHGHTFLKPDKVLAIPPGADHLHLEIPSNIAEVKAHAAPGVAQEWQQAVRDAFQAAFGAGFVAVGFSRAEPGRPRYVLERRP
jgi:predicted GNAT superfamily acetyltransferase